MFTSTHWWRSFPFLVSLMLTVAVVGGAGYGQTPSRGTLKHPIIDSRMSNREAFDGLDPKCPDEIKN